MLLPIPVKPYVRHLLIKHYGKEPIAVRANSDLGQIFMLALVSKAMLRHTFGFTGSNVPATERDVRGLIVDSVISDMDVPRDNDGRAAKDLKARNNDIEIVMPEGCVELKFLVGGKFKKGVLLPDMIEQLGASLESYTRIYMKGFSHGYRSMFNSGRSSAMAFWSLYEYDEDVLTQDNACKIIQRECGEVNDPIDLLKMPRRSYRLVER